MQIICKQNVKKRGKNAKSIYFITKNDCTNKKNRTFATNFKTQVINIFLYEKNLIKYCNCRCSDNKC